MIKPIILLIIFILLFSAFTLTASEDDQETYGTGLIIYDETYPENSIAPIQNIRNLSFQNSIDLSQTPYFPQVRSQSYSSSCVSWATTYYAYGYLQKEEMSPSFTYNMANGGSDTGSSFSTTLKVLEDWGSCSYSLMPFDPADYVHWGDELAFRDTINQIPIKPISVAFSGQQVIDDIKYLLSDETLVCISFDASAYTEGFSDGNYIISSEEYDTNTVNHAQTIVGYDDTITDDGDIGAFRVVNSWGSSWGDAGFYWLTYDAFNEIILKVYHYLIPQTNYDTQTYLEIRFSVTPSRERFEINGDIKWYAIDTDHQLPNYLCIRTGDHVTLSIGETEIIGMLSSCVIHKNGLRSGEADNLPIQTPFTVGNEFNFSGIEMQGCVVG